MTIDAATTWTVDELIARLAASAALRRLRNRHLLRIAAGLILWLVAAGCLGTMDVSVASTMVAAWFAALAAFLLYVVFTAGVALSAAVARRHNLGALLTIEADLFTYSTSAIGSSQIVGGLLRVCALIAAVHLLRRLSVDDRGVAPLERAA